MVPINPGLSGVKTPSTTGRGIGSFKGNKWGKKDSIYKLLNIKHKKE